MNNVNRRSFLGSASVAATLGTLPLSSHPLLAIEPLKRTGTPKFKFSLAAYSYRDLFRSKKLTLSDFISDCAKFGLEGAELTSYYFPQSPSESYLHQLKRECFLAGLDVSGTAVGNDFCHPEGEQRDRQIQSVKDWIVYAARLGAPVIRIFSGKAKPDMSVDAAHRLAVAGIEECCNYAGEHGIHLALENHGGLTATAEGL